MSRRTNPEASPTRWLALDIGGANLKAAHSDGPMTDGAFRGLAATGRAGQGYRQSGRSASAL